MCLSPALKNFVIFKRAVFEFSIYYTINISLSNYFEGCIVTMEGGILIIKERGMDMAKQNEYVAAELSQNLVSELKSFEEKLSEQSHKNLVVIAYEKDEE
jgi:hypothetical protein